MRKNISLCAPLPTPDEMAQWDQAAQSLYGISPLLLMENAAQAAVSEIKSCGCLPAAGNVLIVMGKGNNGGDGAAVARILHDEGHRVLVCAAAPLDSLPSPAREHAAMAAALGVSFRFFNEADRSSTLENFLTPEFSPDLVVDALTGTGIKGNLRPRELALVRLINSYAKRACVISLDIPSGLDGLTGKPMPEAVRARRTICFEAGKPGLFMPEADSFTGSLTIRRVGIPLELRKRMPPSWKLLSPEKGDWSAPSRLGHKGSAGKVLVIGGSEGMAGAPLLAALGSLRAGAGLAHVALPAALEPAARAGWPEFLTHPVGSGAQWNGKDAHALPDLMRRIAPDALVIGPGMGRSPDTAVLLQAILEVPERPVCILDADALFFLRLPDADHTVPQAGDKEPSRLTGLLRHGDILTPHPGEMVRMLPDSFFARHGASEGPGPDLAQRIAIVQNHRPEALRAFTGVCPAVLVLKGPGSLIGRAGEATALSPFAVSTLGVGGSGDVLSGICASLAASGYASLDAACLGVYLHGLAGEILAGKSGRGHLAREIADAVPAAWEALCRS